MFVKSLDLVRHFTLPVCFTRRFRDGRIGSGLGTFVVINPDGWVLTAAHIMADILQFENSQRQIKEHDQLKAKIESDSQMTDKEKRRAIQKLPVSNDWITHQAAMWGNFNWRATSYVIDGPADLALVHLDGFDPHRVSQYPIFKDSSSRMAVGTSLCRLGYPFHEIKASFDSGTGGFTMDTATFPIPQFPNDGIYTRLILRRMDDGRIVKLIETSTPGLRGQSGGPVFDREGRIWAIQSLTNSLPLGFAPKIRQGSKEIIEHQFMHVGWGVHVEEVTNLMKGSHVKFSIGQ